MLLDVALETYRQNLASLLKDEGKFVLVFDREVIGVFGTYADALSIGYEKFGVQPFLVKKIQSVEQAQSFTRSLSSSCPT